MELYKQVHGEHEEAVENLEKVKFKAKQSKIDMENDIRGDEITIEAYK